MMRPRQWFRLRSLAVHAVVVLGCVPGMRAVHGFDEAGGPPRPNIVLIMADDLGYGDLGCSGNGYHETPNIDRLAARGLSFLSHHHGPNCQPTRAALMTGQYSPRTGIYTVGSIDRFDWKTRPLRPVENVTALPLDRVTIADQLKQAGYVTGMFGKWHLGDEGDHHPGQRGFDEAIVTMGKHRDFRTFPAVAATEGTYLADFLTDRAVDFIERHQRRPFFLYLPHFAVHAPLEAKPELVEYFRGKSISGKHTNPTYAAMIASLDESVGRVMTTLEELQLTGTTVVIFTSDNGGVGGYRREGLTEAREIADNTPLRSGKGSLYEGGTRVPFIVSWPGIIPPETTCDEPTIHVDVFATLLELTGAPRPSHEIDGESLFKLFRSPAGTLVRDEIFQHFPGYLGSGANQWRTTPVSVVQSGDWKLMEFLEDGRLELYNLREDIGERRNLVEEEADRAEALRRRLAAWRAKIHAPMPTHTASSEE